MGQFVYVIILLLSSLKYLYCIFIYFLFDYFFPCAFSLIPMYSQLYFATEFVELRCTTRKITPYCIRNDLAVEEDNANRQRENDANSAVTISHREQRKGKLRPCNASSSHVKASLVSVLFPNFDEWTL